ncbi:MAG: quinone-dependent dihydroorotate dehydrogenase [Xanthomonadales bacterium]|nr:quinone-dependent dihydroorotate dehydrogenase [Xanthomonadales bacterium]
MIPFAFIRPALHKLAPETAHDVALKGLSWAGPLARLAASTNLQHKTQLFGHELLNPVGLAAGLDKNGDYINGLGRLGFGFIEVGTITPRPQAGNPKPRLFRLPESQAIINRMGFNNKGVDHLVKRLRCHHFSGVLGVNIGKNKDTPNEQAADDYIACLEKVYAYADYITVNLSSPNTAGLRDLQAPAALADLLGRIVEARNRAAEQHGEHVPLVVKVAPDLNHDDIPAMADVIANCGIEGVIATNTTIQRPQVQNQQHGNETGGLSGAPLKPFADDTLARFHAALPAEIVRIGCGGISNGQDAVDKFQRGAQAVQIYTGFIYQGPQLISDAVQALKAAQVS